MTKEQLLAELEDLLRTAPPLINIHQQSIETHSWLGRAAALIDQWDSAKSVLFRDYLHQTRGVKGMEAMAGLSNLLNLA